MAQVVILPAFAMWLRRVPALCLVAFVSVFATSCKEEQGGVKVADLSFTGVKAVSQKQLKSILATAESSKLPWGPKHYFGREQFEADLKRIEAFYADRGFPDARVKSFDARLSDDQTSVKVQVNIAEGEPVTVERVVLEGFESLPDERESQLPGQLPLKQGQPLDRALMQASRETALDALRDSGFPYASVRVTEAPGSERQRAVVTLQADAGPDAIFGPIEIVGNTSVSDAIVRRQLWFRPGQLFEQSKLRESQRRLYGLELFQFVNVEPVGLENRSDEVGTRVTVAEGKHRRVNFGVGYGSEEKARAEVDWRHVNFFGGARTAGVHARYSALDRGVRLNLNQPYFINRFYSFGVTGQAWFTDEPAFVLTTIGGRATVTRQFRRGGTARRGVRPTTTLAITYANEWEDYTISEEALNDPSFRDELIALGLDPTTGSDTGQLSSLAVDFGRNTTENLLDARSGYVAAVHIEQAGRWLGGDFDFHELTLEGRYYISLGEKAVIAVRGRVGSIDASGPEAELVPFFKRYFLGGSTNLRGWGRYEVSPLSGDGLPIGGHSFMNFSTELRVPLFGNLGAVVFLDGGNVWTDPWGLDFNDMRYDAGPGIRYNTPVGPFRLDLGYQLNPIEGLIINGEPEKRRFRVHFSIGHAF